MTREEMLNKLQEQVTAGMNFSSFCTHMHKGGTNV